MQYAPLHRRTDTRQSSDLQSAYFPGTDDRSFCSEIDRIFEKADDAMKRPEFKRADTSLSTATTRMQYGTLRLPSSTLSDAGRTVQESLEQKSFENLSFIDNSSEPLNILYSKKLQDSRELLSKIDLSYQRHLSLKKYSGTLHEQLKTSVMIARQELRSHYEGLVGELSHKLEEAMNQLEVSARAKESLFKDRDNELDCYLRTISEARQVLELKMRAEPKGKFVQNFMQTKREAEEAMEIWASDFSYDGESCKVKAPEFSYVIRSTAKDQSLETAKPKMVELDLKALDKRRREIIARSRPYLKVPDPEEASRASTPTCTTRKAAKASDEETRHRRKHASGSRRRETLKPSLTVSSR
jgi:hypothetical protein